MILFLVSNDVGASSSDEAESDDPELLEQIERERIIAMYEKVNIQNLIIFEFFII